MSEHHKPLSEERKAVERLLARTLITAVVAVLLWLLAPIIWDKLSVFIICVPIAAMVQPIIRFLQNKCHFKRTPAVLLPVLLFIALVCLLLYWFASFGFSQLSSLITSTPTLLAEGVSAIRIAFDKLLAAFNTLPAETESWLRTTLNNALASLTSVATSAVRQILPTVTSMATGIPYAFVYLNFLVVAMYFVAKDYDEIRSKLPGGRAHDPNTNASRLTRAGVMGALGYIRVQATYAMISLVVGWLYLQCFGFSYAWLIATVAAILEFLPLFGNGTLYIPWSIIAYVIGMNDVGTEMIVLYMMLIVFRRITEPHLMSANIGVTPLLSLIGMFVGMRAGGLLGLMGGPIVMTVLGALFTGPYLNGVRKDLRTLTRYFRRRWDWGEKVPYVPDTPAPSPDPAPAKQSAKAKPRTPRR